MHIALPAASAEKVLAGCRVHVADLEIVKADAAAGLQTQSFTLSHPALSLKPKLCQTMRLLHATHAVTERPQQGSCKVNGIVARLQQLLHPQLISRKLEKFRDMALQSRS